MPPTPPPGAAATLIGMLITTTALSQLYRTSTGVIAPELVRDLALTPAMLGFANGSFFLALLATQIPVGLMFDRVGARITVLLLAIVAVLGSLMHGLATDGHGLALARMLVGIGHGGSFMAAVFLVSRWWPRPLWATALSWVFAASMLGIVAAGTPLALVSEAAGWRAAFIGLALIQALAGLLFWVLVRDDPPGQPPKVRHPETLTTMLAGFWTVLRLPGLVRVMALQLVGYAVQVTVIGLWAGPYLHDVHGLDATARGNVVVAMAIAQLAGVLAYGPLDRILDSRKRVAAAGAFLTILPLATLAAYDQPPTALAIALLITTSAVSSYGIVVVTHGRSFYPEPLAGRGTTTFNTVQAIGCVLMPMLTALIPALYPITPRGWAPEAYRMIFGAIATALVLGLAVYMTSRDARPSSL